MKNKTLALITAAIITSAALILTAGLSLLSSSAVDEPVIDADDAIVSAADPAADDAVIGDGVQIEVNTEDVNDVEVDNNVDEEIYVDPAPDVDKIVDTRLPDLDTLDVAKVVNENEIVTWEYVLWHDIVIDVFDHSTGELVGQVWITDDEIYSEFCDIFHADFDSTAELFDPHNPDDIPVFLPEAKYRVEFSWIERMTDSGSGCAGSLAFSYGVENNEIYEFTQTGYPLGNGETVIAYMESLAAEKIAQLESGVNDELEAGDSLATVFGMDGEDGYWNGYTDPHTGERMPGVDRYTPRFPYIQG